MHAAQHAHVRRREQLRSLLTERVHDPVPARCHVDHPVRVQHVVIGDGAGGAGAVAPQKCDGLARGRLAGEFVRQAKPLGPLGQRRERRPIRPRPHRSRTEIRSEPLPRLIQELVARRRHRPPPVRSHDRPRGRMSPTSSSIRIASPALWALAGLRAAVIRPAAGSTAHRRAVVRVVGPPCAHCLRWWPSPKGTPQPGKRQPLSRW
jgi:hypothetical protein